MVEGEVLLRGTAGLVEEGRVEHLVEVEPLLGAQQGNLVSDHIGDTVLSADYDCRLLSRASCLGGDEHDSVCRTRTVYRGRGSVLHDCDVLDVVGVQCGEDRRRNGAAVEYEQRLGASVDRVHTADTHRDCLARLAGVRPYLQSGDLSLEGVTYACGRGVLEQLRTDGGRRTGNGRNLLGGTVSEHDSVGQHLYVRSEDDVHAGTAVELDLCAFIAENRHYERAVGGNGIEGVVTAHIRHRILGRAALELHDCAHNRLSGLGIRDHAGDIDILGRCKQCRSRESQSCEQKFRFFHKHLH